jgi:hypothetical protein
MSTANPSYFTASPTARKHRSVIARDITWDRPVFLPPMLPNPRIMFDPLPFTAQRLMATIRQVTRR